MLHTILTSLAVFGGLPCFTTEWEAASEEKQNSIKADLQHKMYIGAVTVAPKKKNKTDELWIAVSAIARAIS